MSGAGPGSKTKGLFWLAAALLAGGAAALGVPFLARQIPWSVETRLAALQKGLPEIQECDREQHRRASALFEKAVRRVYPLYPSDKDFPIQVRVIRGKTVNAFAFLGGQVFVYEGLLQQTESAEELAGIVAHEIEHVRRRHIIQGVLVRLMTVGALEMVLSGSGALDPKLAEALLHLRFSREQEQEADEGALQRLHDGRVAVAGFENFFRRAENMTVVPTLLSDHPANDARVQMAQRFPAAASVPIMSRAEWALVKNICQ